MASHLTEGVPSGTTTVQGREHSADAQATAWPKRNQCHHCHHFHHCHHYYHHHHHRKDLAMVAAAMRHHPRHFFPAFQTTLDCIQSSSCLFTIMIMMITFCDMFLPNLEWSSFLKHLGLEEKLLPSLGVQDGWCQNLFHKSKFTEQIEAHKSDMSLSTAASSSSSASGSPLSCEQSLQ